MIIRFNIKKFEITDYKESFGVNFHKEQGRLIVSNFSRKLDKKLEESIKLINSDSTIEGLTHKYGNGFLIILFENQNLYVFRDGSGFKTAYYKYDGDFLYISDNCHKIAQITSGNEFKKSIIDQLLFSEFVLDGFSIYKNIFEFKRGSKSLLKKGSEKLESLEKLNLNLAKNDNALCYETNKRELKNQILKAHEFCLGAKNVVYLSGGIDSCVMLASLDEIAKRDSINNVSYYVKGTNQNETFFAKKAANYLGYNCEVIEIDPHSDKIVENLESRLLQYNNPYIGIMIFSPLLSDDYHYFAGQDTRLHTPDVNKLTNYVIHKVLKKSGSFSTKRQSKLLNYFMSFYYSSPFSKSNNIYIRNLDHIFFGLLSKEDYVNNILLKNNPDKVKQKFKLNNIENQERNDHFIINQTFDNIRQFYNTIIEKKWDEQYTDDIKYMMDMGKETKNFTQMPFYNMQLSRFSSSIPFGYCTMHTKGTDKFSNKSVRVNKKLLREAFKGQIPNDLLYRKKAVSLTVALLFNGKLGDIVMREIKRDLQSCDSLIKEYNYTEFVQKFLNTTEWIIVDQQYLLRVFYLYTILVYKKNNN